MKVWYVLLDQSHPSDADPTHRDSPAEQALQSAYRQTILDGTHIYHPSTTLDQTKLRIHEWRNDLDRLRDESRRHAARQDAISQEQTELLKRLIKGQEELAHRARADGKTLTDYTSEEILAELAKDLATAPRFRRTAVHEVGDDLWERYERT